MQLCAELGTGSALDLICSLFVWLVFLPCPQWSVIFVWKSRFLETVLDLSEIALLAILSFWLIGIILVCQQITLTMPVFLTTNLTD